jgi:hypothetical protein
VKPPRVDQQGSAIIEFLVIGVALLIPVVYLALAAATIQAAAFASQQAVREAARAFSSSDTVIEGRRLAVAAARLAFADHDLTLPPDALKVTCSGGPCLAPGSAIDVTIAWSAPLPWLPERLWDAMDTGVRVEAVHRVPVDDYRGSPS